MDYSPDSQDSSQIGFEFIYSEGEINVLLLKSSPIHFRHYLPQKVKDELKDFFSKYEKFCNLQKARNYAMGRWVGFELLRRVLGQNIVEKCKIINAKDDYCFGKPLIFQDHKELPYCISLAHSDYYAVSGFSKDKAIGVDLEYQKPRSDSFVDLLLTTNERITVETDEARRDELVTAIWAGKEAVSKVVGRGLRIPLKNFEIELNLEGLYKNRMTCWLSDSLVGSHQFWFRLFQKDLGGGRYLICVAGPLK